MSERSCTEIEKDLADTRKEMTETVNLLVSAVSPKDNLKRAKASALEKVQLYTEKAQELIDRAKNGDRQAQKILAGVAAGTGLVVALLVRKILK